MAMDRNVHSFELGFIQDHTKQELLARLRTPEPFDKQAWILKDLASGAVLAKRIAGVIEIDQDVCQKVLGEPV